MSDQFDLDNPVLVRWEYASEERLAARNQLYHDLTQGGDADDAVFAAVAEFAPDRALDVGCGTGDLAFRIQRDVGCQIVAVDTSARMVELTRERGIDARVEDVQSLPFRDGEFDCVVAAWVLYHVRDRERAIAEIARVLRPGGRLVAATMGARYLEELWTLVGADPEIGVGFNGVNGDEQLRRHFAQVRRVEASSTLVFPDAASMRRYIAATMTRAHLAPLVPEFAGPVEVRAEHTVFVADKAA